MKIHTFRARTMREALDAVRKSLGADASILHTRVKNQGFLARAIFGQSVEVAATLPEPTAPSPARDVVVEFDYRGHYRDLLGASGNDDRPALDDLLKVSRVVEESTTHMPEELFQLFAELIEADVDESTARQLLAGVQAQLELSSRISLHNAREILLDLIIEQLEVSGPLQVGEGSPRIVALVGPTGVGKTTTIAKLAANYRLRENRRVGLITVDTYRVAAVEQLRTYADIIDLPMEVVSTPHEVQDAIESMRELDLILMDTAGRSPRDAVRIHELRHLLAAADPDDVLLVASTTASGRALQATCREFAPVGTTALVLTKLDEAMSLGHLVSVLRDAQLPVSYLTDGQNVPDDIAIASRETLARRLLGLHADATFA